ncbi:MAG: hypothetical protein HYY17_04580 [Planctomycetes bacterium]|nr:hypothetical protein [Planctomycetota bacterium]
MKLARAYLSVACALLLAPAAWAQDPAQQLENYRTRIDTGISERLIPEIGKLSRGEYMDRLRDIKEDLADAERVLRQHPDARTNAEWVEEYRSALTATEDSLTEFREGLRKASEVNSKISDLVTKLLPMYLKDAIAQTKDKAPDEVKDYFIELKKDTNAEVAPLEPKKTSAETSLGNGKRQARPLQAVRFRPLCQAIDRACDEALTLLRDQWKTLEEDHCLMEIRLAEKSVICRCCMAGKPELATEYMRTWSAPTWESDEVLDIDRLPPLRGWIDVRAHGTPDYVILQKGGNRIEADADAIYEMLKKDVGVDVLKRWRTVHKDLKCGVRLVSCRTGTKPTGIAQQLANRLGVTVKAPTRFLWVPRHEGVITPVVHECNKCIFKAPKGMTKDEARWMLDHILETKDLGTWEDFEPDKSAAEQLKKTFEAGPYWGVTITKVETKYATAAEVDKVLKALKELDPGLDDAKARTHLTKDYGKAISWEFRTKLNYREACTLQRKLKELKLTSRLVEP